MLKGQETPLLVEQLDFVEFFRRATPIAGSSNSRWDHARPVAEAEGAGRSASDSMGICLDAVPLPDSSVVRYWDGDQRPAERGRFIRVAPGHVS